MLEEEIKYWVGVSGFRGLGIKRLQLLRQYFGTVKKIWHSSKAKWLKLGIKAEMVNNWEGWRRNRDLDKEMLRLNKDLIKVITIEDKNYPKLLKEIDFPPFLIYVKGSVEVLNQPSLAVIGTRRQTEYGRKAARKLTADLVKHNLTVVSGLARGIDATAHWQCLKSGGKTIAVLGHGLERIYPPDNRLLAEAIIKSNGALITEYPLDFPLDKTNFPLRNRIIAGLSLGTLVVEGGERSGTKITANFAADYGREVFCVSGPMDSLQSQGPADLIHQGAKLVTKVEDILEELAML